MTPTQPSTDTTDTTDTSTAASRSGAWLPIERPEAMTLAEGAYDRIVEVIASIRDDQWSLPTDCTGWTVRDLAGHMLGALRSAASVRELVSQQAGTARLAKRNGTSIVDAMTQLQIDRTASLTTSELVAECRSLTRAAARGRARTPGLLRRLVKVRVVMGTIDERWALGYLVDTILTRDAWLHRIDLCRALGVAPVLTADHDGRIVGGVATEWLRRHGQPVRLVLTGTAGGVFEQGDAGAPTIELDAVEFCRILSGRATGDGLLGTEVPF